MASLFAYFLEYQQHDIIDLINTHALNHKHTDITFFCENKNNIYYPIRDILLNYMQQLSYCHQLQTAAVNICNEKNNNAIDMLTDENISYKSLSNKISSTICDNIRHKLHEYMSSIHYKSDIRYQLIKLTNSFKIDESFCTKNFNIPFMKLNDIFHFTQYKPIQFINDSDFMNLYNSAVDIYESAHIADINKYLLELDDDNKIGQFYGEINYTPHNISLRDGPIVIYRQKSTNKDVVLIGSSGDYHSDLGQYIHDADQQHYDYGYYYRPCAFIDEARCTGYTTNKLAQILVADPRIKKVYLSPAGINGGKLKRLATCLVSQHI